MTIINDMHRIVKIFEWTLTTAIIYSSIIIREVHGNGIDSHWKPVGTRGNPVEMVQKLN